MIAGLYAAVGLLTALRSVEVRGGSGQVVDISLFEPIFSLISVATLQYHLTGIPMRRNGNQSSHAAPRNLYACADGRYVALSGSTQGMAEKIFQTIGRPELIDDPRFRTNDDRLANCDALDAIIGGFIGLRTRDDNLSLFEEAAVTVGPVYSAAELIGDPYVVGRGVIVEVDDGEMSLPMHAVVTRLSSTPGSIHRARPATWRGRPVHHGGTEREEDQTAGDCHASEPGGGSKDFANRVFDLQGYRRGRPPGGAPANDKGGMTWVGCPIAHAWSLGPAVASAIRLPMRSFARAATSFTPIWIPGSSTSRLTPENASARKGEGAPLA